MLVFVHRLNLNSDEFIFKGGNLLWLYIRTPRSTIDADFVTRTLTNHEEVKNALQDVCSRTDDDIVFSILKFEGIEKKGKRGASVTIQYTTREGQKNTFDLDIVYSIPSSTNMISSPVSSEGKIAVVTIENIIADKLSACHQFKGGNTRMKDFDDLWRISRINSKIVDWKALKKILVSRGIEAQVVPEWINELMIKSWKSHSSRNKGLPPNLSHLMTDVNNWLKGAQF